MYAVQLTEDAQLRPLEPWQATEFLAHIERARPTVDPFIPWAGFSTDLDSARATLQRYADMQAADTGRIYGIWLADTLVGGLMFFRFDADGGGCELGCWLEESAQGRGLIGTAARRLLDWAFRERGMHRVEWHTSPQNVRSGNVARRLGMTLEGTLREAYPHGGRRHDTQIWSLLATEWPTPA
ncbi:GNAT family N-acetyltransferase [Plantactinospora sp. KBS50]|uniref:GNAT family N-acetyltransferase n=1 Tax=Plantactinospora sp. KBS50 TaxID=2024580 RepID=UPI000BAAB90B|nr:GNAT family protein [Plantactinospora sp. KBS50]ASW55980.1 RimJ/RimL family protein N-acetyltransferase [Plantactinospora sp. KBS50]